MSDLKFIGEVGVDSGQLMICDPCYIDSEWEGDSDNPVVPFTFYKDYETGKCYACSITACDHGDLVEKYDVTVFKFWDKPLADYDGKTPNEVRSRWSEHTVEASVVREFSYPGVCNLTLSSDGFGQLYYRKGHAGVAVASSTNYGDGTYPVYAVVDAEGRPTHLVVNLVPEHGFAAEPLIRDLQRVDRVV
jgi:hypothetical protein